MSNTLAIAVVSAVLQARLRSVLDANSMSAFTVSALPPINDPDAGVYLHLFQVLPNTALQPETLPTRRRDGLVAARPRLALNLHYQMTFVGNTNNTSFDAERLAGLVLIELHSRPALHPDEISAFMAGLGGGHPLAAADLADQLERVRFTFTPMDLEDQSRLWSMLNQSFHALTVRMEASVVLLDDQVTPSDALPVRQSAVTVFPIAAPQLTGAVSTARRQPIVQLWPSGDPRAEALVLRGSGLLGAVTRVRIGGVELPIDIANASPTELRLELNDASGVASGIVPVNVVHYVDLDPDPGTTSLRGAGQSGTLAVALVPTLTAVTAIPDGTEHVIEVAVVPFPGASQELTLMLDRVGGGRQLRSSVPTFGGATVSFRVAGATAGDYVVRLTVDGATSLFAPAGGGTFSPTVAVP